MLIPQSVRLVYCYFGNGIALGVYGTQEEIDVTLNGLYNHQGHDDEARYLSDGFGYVLTTKEKLERGLANCAVAALHPGLHKHHNPDVWPRAQAIAAKTMQSIKHEPFLTSGSPAKEYALASQTEW